jgi:hypothetical protein
VEWVWDAKGASGEGVVKGRSHSSEAEDVLDIVVCDCREDICSHQGNGGENECDVHCRFGENECDVHGRFGLFNFRLSFFFHLYIILTSWAHLISNKAVTAADFLPKNEQQFNYKSLPSDSLAFLSHCCNVFHHLHVITNQNNFLIIGVLLISKPHFFKVTNHF